MELSRPVQDLVRGMAFEQLEEFAHHGGVVVPGSAADQVVVDDNRLVDIGAAPLRDIEGTLGDGGQGSAGKATRRGGDFDTVADGADWLAGVEEVLRHGLQVEIVADVFGGSSA